MKNVRCKAKIQNNFRNNLKHQYDQEGRMLCLAYFLI